MTRKSAIQTVAVSAPGDMQLVHRAMAHEADAFRAIIKTHNQRLYRIARGVVRNDSEAEDIVQEAYVRAFAALATFRGDACEPRSTNHPVPLEPK